MGTIAEGNVTVGGTKVKVQGDFGSDHVTFSGGRRGQVKYSTIEVVGTGKGVLRIRVDGNMMEFDLGDKVERIAAKIRKPPSRLDKMGLKLGMAIDLIGEAPMDFLKELDARGIESATTVEDGMVARIAFAPEAEALLEIPAWTQGLADDTALWIVFPKGGHQIRELDVIGAGREAGMKDVKVVRFNDKLTALKFVVPVADRGRQR